MESHALDEAEGRPNVQLAAVRELRAVVELLGRLTGAFMVEEGRPTKIILTLSDGRQIPPRRPYLESLPEGDDDGASPIRAAI